MFAQNAPQGGPALINASGFVQAHGSSKWKVLHKEISENYNVYED
ncbi:MAG: hypothetical protein QOE55_1312 [Acidobacteriaceae bacterium]|jgi:hypothetical protein|nr:hypothetical protein [Acidobacteriaceae bacterium]